MKRIDIMAEGRACPVLIGRGLIDQAGTLAGGEGRRFLITDANVVRAGWAARAEASLKPVLTHVLAPGDENKTLKSLEALLDALIDAGIERGDRIFALGGGMVGDMAGFAAAIVKRGCACVQIPTSLLAQADSAIGGKTGVNMRQGKNLIGAFHHPEAVLIDPAALETLPMRQIRSGYAEIVKYGLIADAAFFDWCEANGADVLAGDDAARAHAIETAVRAKAAIVADDPRETKGARMLLNFGHSFAHAIEAETGFSDRVTHGEAVAIGMTMAFHLSVRRGLCPAGDAERVEAHFRAAGLPVSLADAGIKDARTLTSRMAHDKKRRGGRLPLILTGGIGKAVADESVGEEEVAAFLAEEGCRF